MDEMAQMYGFSTKADAKPFWSTYLTAGEFQGLAKTSHWPTALSRISAISS